MENTQISPFSISVIIQTIKCVDGHLLHIFYTRHNTAENTVGDET